MGCQWWWGGEHTLNGAGARVKHGGPTAVVGSHPAAPFHFVTEGVDRAVAKAQEIAGDKAVAVTAGTIAGQCLNHGLLDAVAIDLVPVVMGRGRPFFAGWNVGDALLEDPVVCVQGDRVTHLVYPTRTP